MEAAAVHGHVAVIEHHTQRVEGMDLQRRYAGRRTRVQGECSAIAQRSLIDPVTGDAAPGMLHSAT